MKDENLPDNVAPNPHSLPYASNLGAPVIKPDHSFGWLESWSSTSSKQTLRRAIQKNKE